MQINIVTLGVEDLPKATDFYQQWFRTPPASASNENITFFNFKGAKLALYPRIALAEDATIEASGSGFRGITLAINADSENEVDTLFSEALQHGAKALKQPQKVFWGGYSSYVCDLDGHIWEIAWNPFFPKNADGELTIP